MRDNKTRRFSWDPAALLARMFLGCVAVFCISGFSLQAFTGGGWKIETTGTGKTYLCLPFQPPAEVAARITAVQSPSISFSGVNWEPGTFAAANTQRPRYYVEFADGPVAGLQFAILANTENRLVLDTAGRNLGALPIGEIGIGSIVRIIPFWTLATVFGQSDSPMAKSAPGVPVADLVKLPDTDNPDNELRQYYLDEGGIWRRVGGTPTENYADLPLWPGQPVIVETGSAFHLANLGVVNSRPLIRPVFEVGTARSRQVFLSVPHPQPVALDRIGLKSPHPQLDLFSSSPNLVRRTDTLTIVQRSPAGIEEQMALAYVAGRGWYDLRTRQSVSGETLLQPGAFLMIQKSAGGTASYWKFDPATTP